MTLWDLVSVAQYTQVFSIYTQNNYSQNIPVARGTRADMLAIDVEDGEENFFSHLMNKVEYYSVNEKGVMVVFLRDEDFEERAERHYSEDYVKKWDNLKPETRPWLHTIETEEYMDKYIDKFPKLEESEWT